MATPTKGFRYLEEVRGLPRPSAAQVEDFVEYVAAAHSWYKHLPPFPPGEPFVFYLDPNAGREWVLRRSGEGRFRDRSPLTPPEKRFHYTWRPTVIYHEQFGHLQYFANAGTSFVVPTPGGLLQTSMVPKILGSDGAWLPVPEPLRDVATVNLTGTIHPLGQSTEWWTYATRLTSGGRALMTIAGPTPDDSLAAAIHDRLRRGPSNADAFKKSPEAIELRTRLLPAHAFLQKEEMARAIRRALEWVYDEGVQSA